MKLSRILLVLALTLGMATQIYAAQTKPVELAADVIEYDSTTGIMTGQGTIKLTQGNAVVTGSNVNYNTKTQEAVITGGVKLVQDNAVMTAEELRSYDNNHIIASGDVELVKGDNTLTGPQIDYYADKSYAVINNNARLKMPDGIMTANKIEAYMSDNQIVGTGNVHIVSQTRQLDATADQASYYGAKGEQGRVVLTGNAKAVQEGNVLQGNKLTIYLDDNAVNAQGRTKLVIQPQ
ncbi:LptA/OstA family protein [Dendrosporobacter sp. 1207_IL3150]|uniref:LptA/OstA family protein n=1 Tax=Dendrosporobacter sp. 1207_IL3150 TaxID=3084054 RepID=UPI002FDB4CBC